MVFCISVFPRSTKSQPWLLRRVNINGSALEISYKEKVLHDRLHNMSIAREDSAFDSGAERKPMDPRGYQLEMLAESMSKNIIVAVSNLYSVVIHILMYSRWTQEVARHTCKYACDHSGMEQLHY